MSSGYCMTCHENYPFYDVPSWNICPFLPYTLYQILFFYTIIIIVITITSLITNAKPYNAIVCFYPSILIINDKHKTYVYTKQEHACIKVPFLTLVHLPTLLILNPHTEVHRRKKKNFLGNVAFLLFQKSVTLLHYMALGFGCCSKLIMKMTTTTFGKADCCARQLHCHYNNNNKLPSLPMDVILLHTSSFQFTCFLNENSQSIYAHY